MGPTGLRLTHTAPLNLLLGASFIDEVGGNSLFVWTGWQVVIPLKPELKV